jgi:hypothetical protein
VGDGEYAAAAIDHMAVGIRTSRQWRRWSRRLVTPRARMQVDMASITARLLVEGIEDPDRTRFIVDPTLDDVAAGSLTQK